MVFYLLSGIDFNPSPLTIKSLENLAHAGRCGIQLVVGDRRALETLSECEGLSASARSYFRRMAQWITQIGTAIDQEDKLRIDLANDGSLGAFGEAVPVDTFAMVDYCEKSQIVTENLTDFGVLVKLATRYLKERFPGFALNLRPQNGGGSTTAQVLEAVGGAPSGPVFCCADSDRRFPSDGLGATARAIKAAKVKDKWRVDCLIIEARELENVLPHDVVRGAAQANRMPIGPVDATLNLPTEYLAYCNFKDGDHLCRMITSAAARSRRDVIAILSDLGDAARPKAHCCGTCPSSGSCFGSFAFGSNFLQAVERYLEQAAFVSDVSLWCCDLMRVIRKLVSFGLVMEPQRV